MFKLIFIWILLLNFFSACAYQYTKIVPDQASEPVSIQDQYVILILIDGLRPQELDRGVRDGKLPTIKSLFYEQGARFQNAITVFPTVSSPAHQAYLSGLQPGHHGIPALDWFSRPLGVHSDYLKPKDIPLTNTLFFNYRQLLEGKVSTDESNLIFNALRGQPTMAIFEPANEGATYKFPKTIPVEAAYHSFISKAYQYWDIQTVQHALGAFRELPASKLPRFSVINFYSMDSTVHFETAESAQAMDLLIYQDKFLKNLVALLKKRGIYSKTTLILLSDHGQHPLIGTVDLPKILFEIGLNIDRRDLRKRQVVWGDHGTGISNLYFRAGKDWTKRPTYSELRNYSLDANNQIDLVKKFLDHPDIEWVIAPEGPWKTHFHRKNQHAVILRRFNNGQFTYAYIPDPGQDPLGYLDNPTVNEWVIKKRFMNAEAWLNETAAEPLPDAVVGIPQVFDDFRGGDMVIITYKEKQFKEDKAFGHGSLDQMDRQVPLMFFGPNIKPGLYPHARLVDVYPTVLALFGLKSPQSIDGVVRWEILQKPTKAIPLRTVKKNFNYANLSPESFKQKLSKIYNPHPPSEFEERKLKQIIYTIDQFLLEQKKYPQP